MNGQHHSDDQGPQRVVVHGCTSQIEIYYSVHYLSRKGLHPHLLAELVDFPHYLLFYVRPRLNLDNIHLGELRKRGKNP